MRVLLKDGLLVVAPETEAEATQLESWKASMQGHVFHLRASNGAGLELRDLGKRADACREPINVVGTGADPLVRIIGNLAPAPFTLDGRHYQSVESFWQGLKFDSDADRLRIAGLDGPHARSEGAARGYGATIAYGGEDIPVGTWRHWKLMEAACRAKFEQNAEAAAALLATGERPLIHVVRRDSRSIPGVIMAAIWMRIRRHMRGG